MSSRRILSCLTVVPIEICGGIDLAMDHLHMPMCIDAGLFTNSTPSRVGLKSSPTMLSSQLNGELAGRPRHQIEVWASEKFSRRLGGGMQLGREPCYRLGGNNCMTPHDVGCGRELPVLWGGRAPSTWREV